MRYLRAFGEESWWDDETAADASWWAAAAKYTGNTELYNTIVDAYQKVATLAEATGSAVIQATQAKIRDELARKARAAGDAESQRLAVAAEARIKKAAGEAVWGGALVGAGAVLGIYLLFRK